MTKFIERMSFWDKIKKVLRLIAGVSLVEMGIHNAPMWAIISLGVFGFLAEIADIFIVDADGDGKIDAL